MKETCKILILAKADERKAVPFYNKIKKKLPEYDKVFNRIIKDEREHLKEIKKISKELRCK